MYFWESCLNWIDTQHWYLSFSIDCFYWLAHDSDWIDCGWMHARIKCCAAPTTLSSTSHYFEANSSTIICLSAKSFDNNFFFCAEFKAVQPIESGNWFFDWLLGDNKSTETMTMCHASNWTADERVSSVVVTPYRELMKNENHTSSSSSIMLYL
jgi:hypothetical protein